jgi:hypothetical protein
LRGNTDRNGHVETVEGTVEGNGDGTQDTGHRTQDTGHRTPKAMVSKSHNSIFSKNQKNDT